jgi:hypothetical protein
MLNFVELRKGEVRRMPLPRTRVNISCGGYPSSITSARLVKK